VNHKLLGVLLVASVSSFTACIDQQGSPVEEDETSTAVQESHGHGPDPQDEMFAAAVADAMIDRLVALLFREFAVTTADNAPVGTAAISNIFHDDNKLMRLVGDVQPLRSNDRPRDDFERDALAAAKLGNNFSRTERVNGRWWVRKSLAVSTGFSTSCVFCHANFASVTNPWVGALMVRAEVDD